jgi:hypothetical protein
MAGVINPKTNAPWTKAEAHFKMMDMLETAFFLHGVVAEQHTAELNGTTYVEWQVARSARLDADYAAWKKKNL